MKSTLVLESGGSFLLESGGRLLIEEEAALTGGALLLQDGFSILLESGGRLLLEGITASEANPGGGGSLMRYRLPEFTPPNTEDEEVLVFLALIAARN